MHLDLSRARLAARGLLSTPQGRHRSSDAADPSATDPSTATAAADSTAAAPAATPSAATPSTATPAAAAPAAAAPAAAAAATATDPGVRVRLVRGSLLELSSLELGRFDYVNCVGVTHHLPDPAAALRGLAKHALSPRGGLGLMVYGTGVP